MSTKPRFETRTSRDIWGNTHAKAIDHATENTGTGESAKSDKVEAAKQAEARAHADLVGKQGPYPSQTPTK